MCVTICPEKCWQSIDQKVRDFVQQFIIEYEVKGQKLELNISNMDKENSWLTLKDDVCTSVNNYCMKKILEI